MAVCWKFLMPLSIINLVAVTLEVYFLRGPGGILTTSDLWIMAAINSVLAVVSILGFGRLIRQKVRTGAAVVAARPTVPGVPTIRNGRRNGQLTPRRGFAMYGLEMAKGLVVTFGNLLRKPFTTSYPEQRVRQHPRFRGEEFAWYEERCTGCASCAKYCPLGIIKIVTAPSATALPQGDKYRLETFDIELQRCMFCGLCVEACPYDALFMGSGFEEGQYRRTDLVIPIDRLRHAEKRPSAGSARSWKIWTTAPATAGPWAGGK